LERQKALVRHGDWTRDAVVYVAEAWRVEALGVGWTNCRIEERRTRTPACERFMRRLRDQILKIRM
jgi:hypothetical protein